MVKRKNSNIQRILSAFLIAVMFLMGFSTNASAFNNGSAVRYADKYYKTYNTAKYRKFVRGDCANYVSQILYAGGMGMNENWRYKNSSTYTKSWAVANDLKDYLKYTYGATFLGCWTKKGTSGDFPSYAYVNNSSNLLGQGNEVIVYDWHGEGIMDHVSFCVRTGKDPDSGRYGDLVNQHTTNRKDAIWNLDPYNPHRKTTRIYAFRV